MVHMDRRQRMQIGIDGVRRDVIDHGADAAGILDGKALVDARVVRRGTAALADDDLSRHLRGIEHWIAARVGREALTQEIRVGSGDAARRRQHDGGRSDAGSQRRAGVHGAVAKRDLRRARSGVRTCRDRRQPGTDVHHTARRGPPFPAEVATNTPARAAKRNATSTASR